MQILQRLFQLRLIVAEGGCQFEVLILHGSLFLLLHLHDFLLQFLDFGRHLCVLEVRARAHFVESVDGLVGEEAVGDVSVCQFDTRQNGIIGVCHVMVLFVALLDVMQDGHGLLHVGGFHDDLLEAALQGTVLLDGVAVFVECGGTDTLDGAACQSRFQDVCGIHASRCAASAHHRVDLVDEDDDVGIVLDFLDECLDALLELSAVLGSCHDARHVETDEALVEEDGTGALLHDQLCQTFHDGTLSDTRFTDEHRVVLLASSQNLRHALNLAFAAHHRVQFALGGSLCEIRAEVVEHRRARLGILAERGTRIVLPVLIAHRGIFHLVVYLVVGHAESVARVSGSLLDVLQHIVVGHVVFLQHHLCAVVNLVVQDGQQQVLLVHLYRTL